MERRRNLYKLYNKTFDLQDTDDSLAKLKLVNEIFTQSNEHYNRLDVKEMASNTDEVLLDAKIVATGSDFCHEAAINVQASQEDYSADQYAEKLMAYLTDEGMVHWDPLHEDALNIINILPNCHVIRIPLEQIELTQNKTIRERLKRLPNAAKSHPDEIVSINKDEESVDETVQNMFSILRAVYKENNSKPVSYYHFIIDADCFGQTVENMFHFSFLIRDATVITSLDENELPYIAPNKSRSDDDVPQETTQFSPSIDYDQWEALKANLNIKYGLYQYKKKCSHKK